MKKINLQSWVLTVVAILTLASCQLKSPLESYQEENNRLRATRDSLIKENLVVKKALAIGLKNNCDTMTVKQKIKWQTLQTFMLDVYQVKEAKMNILISQKNKKEQILFKDKENKIMTLFEKYQKEKTVAMEETIKKDVKAFTAYAIASLKVECDYLKYRNYLKAAKEAPSIKNFLEITDNAWQEKEKAEQIVQQDYQKKLKKIADWKKAEMEEIEKSANDEIEKKKKELGF